MGNKQKNWIDQYEQLIASKAPSESENIQDREKICKSFVW